MNNIRPCRYPECKGFNGEPEITSLGVCERCQKRMERLITWLIEDYVHLTTALPSPMRRQSGVRSKSDPRRGHPAEFASIAAAEIATLLNNAHRALSEHLGEASAPDPQTGEKTRIRAAWAYLAYRIDRLARLDNIGEIIDAMAKQHNMVRSRLGLSPQRRILPTPCPSCSLRTLFHTVEPYQEQIDCGSCGHIVPDELYAWHLKVICDTFLEKDPKVA